MIYFLNIFQEKSLKKSNKKNKKKILLTFLKNLNLN